MLIRAREGVISNAPVWDTMALLPPPSQAFAKAVPKLEEWRKAREAMPTTGSFVHLHLGIDGEGIPPDLDCHHSVILDWGLGITARENMYIVSIPSLFDPSLAPPGKHVVHVYAAASEPFDAWAGMDRRSAEYKRLKAQAAEPLWQALETILPDVRKRVEVNLVGTPLTHQRFTRRHQGTYGPSGGKVEGDLDFLGSGTPIPGLKLCGDSCFPGIGVPSVAASGIIAAHTFVPLPQHLELLGEMQAEGTLCVGRGWWFDDDDDGSSRKHKAVPMAPGGRISMLCDNATPTAVEYGGL
jgi:phytoene dehydrogenase-like protein